MRDFVELGVDSLKTSWGGTFNLIGEACIQGDERISGKPEERQGWRAIRVLEDGWINVSHELPGDTKEHKVVDEVLGFSEAIGVELFK